MTDIVKPTVPEPPKAKPERFKNCVPANWNITLEDDVVTAFNSQSQESFEGTMAEFNERLNG